MNKKKPSEEANWATRRNGEANLFKGVTYIHSITLLRVFFDPGCLSATPPLGMGRAEGTYRIHRRTEAGAEGSLVRAAEGLLGRAVG